MKIFKNLLLLFRPYWRCSRGFVLLSLLFWGVLLPFTNVLLVLFPQRVVDAIAGGKLFSQVVLLVLLFQGAICLIPLFEDVYRFVLNDRVQAKVEIHIKRNIYKQSLATDYRYIDNPDYYDMYTWVVEHQAEKASEAFDLLQNSMGALGVIVSMVGIILTFNPLVVLIVLGNMLLRSYAYRRYYQNEFDRQNELVPCDRKRNYLHRVFYLREYGEDLRSTKLRKFLFSHYDKASEQKLSIIRKYIPKMLGWSMFANAIYRILLAAAIIMIVYSIYYGNLGGATSYLTVILAVEKLDDYMMRFFNLLNQGNRLSLHADHIRDFYQIQSMIETQPDTDGATPAPGAFSVDLHHVGFSYPNSDFTIHDFDLHIRPGEKVAIVGENGVGKSTLVKLLLRLYDPENGEIQINGMPLAAYNIAALRHRIGVVFQRTNVYAMSLGENICLYNEADSEKLHSILKDLGLDTLLEKNDASLDSPMTREFNENGIMVSGGESQKIGLARIMTDDFGLLLLDEPSSALDPIAEYEMNRLLMDRSRQTTTIVIAHRLSTVRDMDRILFMDHGYITENGTHDELMALRGKYYEMFTKQAEKYVD